jgi:hypothetical protein
LVEINVVVWDNVNSVLNIIGLNCCGIKKRLNYLEFEQMISIFQANTFIPTNTFILTDIFIPTNTFIPTNAFIQTNAFFETNAYYETNAFFDSI